MTATRGPQVVLEGYARDVARGGGGPTMRANIAAMDALLSAGLVADGNTVDGSSRTGGKAYDPVVAQFPDEPLTAWEIPAPLLDVAIPGAPFLPLGGNATVTGPVMFTGPLNYTATGTPTLRSAQDRAATYVNILNFGATLDGTTEDGPSLGAAMQVLKANQAVYIPAGSGNTKITWGTAQGSTPSTGVLFQLDGTTNSGARITRHNNRHNKGDLFETFLNGTKYLSAIDCFADQPAVLQIEQGQIVAGGSAGSINTVLRVNTQDNVAALTSTWGVHVQMDTYANAQGSWPQNVGVSATQRKRGSAWSAGMHITATDYQNLPSSTGGTLLGMEIGYHTSDLDDVINSAAFGGLGTRMGLHLSLTDSRLILGTGTIPAEISFGILADGTPNAIVKSVFATSLQTNTYQVLDTRGALAPAGYGNPVAAVRLLHDQIIDFNGGPALNSVAGAYLQYRTATQRLYYVVGGVDQWSVDTSGNVRARGTVTGSTTP